ncbi:MAG: glycine cleavage system protein GcvH [Anaerolineae bacterium]|nr:glycine cleavage system protein GcvH [Anaerolineae bacterium]
MTIKIDPDCLYTKTHEWIRVDGEYAYCGITDYAQQQLSDIVYVELPEVGDSFSQGEVFATVESVKAASDCYLPVAGEIVEINEELEESPDLVNTDPYGDGWFVRFIIEDPEELNNLMDADAYRKYTERVMAEGGH